MSYTLAELAAWTGARLLRGSAATAVTGVAWDSRRVRPGDLFVALQGARVDGHDYLPAAAAAGAAAALVSRDGAAAPPGLAVLLVPDTLLALGAAAAAHRRRVRIPVVGVTGSVGKTTTKELCAAVLAQRFRTFRTSGNLNSEVGLPAALLNELSPDCQAAVLEMGMRAVGEIAYLVSIARPSIGVVTNVGPSHLELLGSLDNIARAKAELVAGLPPDGTAVLNADDPRVAAMAAQCPGAVIYYGIENVPPAGVTLRDWTAAGEAGQRFTLVTPAGTVPVHLGAVGRHVAVNALAAAAVGLVAGLTPAEIAAGLAAYTPVGGRLRVLHAGGVRLIDDTYNASPASVAAALAVLSDLAGGGRRIAVLGDMYELGPAAVEGHRSTGAAAARHADLLLAVGDLARHYADGARAAGMPDVAVLHCPDKAAAMVALAARVAVGDTVLFKGSRGMAMEEMVTALANHLSGSAPGAAAGTAAPGT